MKNAPNILGMISNVSMNAKSTKFGSKFGNYDCHLSKGDGKERTKKKEQKNLELFFFIKNPNSYLFSLFLCPLPDSDIPRSL